MRQTSGRTDGQRTDKVKTYNAAAAAFAVHSMRQ